MARRPKGKLRKGWTTGACAAAAAAAAAAALFGEPFPDPVTLRLPGGETLSFPLVRAKLGGASETQTSGRRNREFREFRFGWPSRFCRATEFWKRFQDPMR